MTHPDGRAADAARSDTPAPAPIGRWASLRAPTVRAAGLLPLRVFLGVTYLYAGVDKFASPHFLTEGDPFNVAAQLAGYAHTSPLAPLINAAMPAAIQIGALIALAELAIGLGVLTGVAFRLAATAGAALSLLFWLTASWSSTPYFFSPDLPYLFAFATLALVGHGGLLVPRFVTGKRAVTETAAARVPGAPDSPGRRSVLQIGVLAAMTAVAAVLATSLRAVGYGGPSAGAGGAARPPSPAPATPGPTPTPAPTQAPPTPAATAAATAAPATPSPTVAPTPSTTAAGTVVGNLSDFASGNNGIAFTVPNDVPFEMGPGGPGIMVELQGGSVVAFSALCTHGRCIVGWDATTSIIQCPCHTARYDPAQGAAVISGPAPAPLPSIPVAVDASGQIRVAATA